MRHYATSLRQRGETTFQSHTHPLKLLNEVHKWFHWGPHLLKSWTTNRCRWGVIKKKPCTFLEKTQTGVCPEDSQHIQSRGQNQAPPCSRTCETKKIFIKKRGIYFGVKMSANYEFTTAKTGGKPLQRHRKCKQNWGFRCTLFKREKINCWTC